MSCGVAGRVGDLAFELDAQVLPRALQLDDVAATRLDGGVGIEPLDRRRRDAGFARPQRVADHADDANRHGRQRQLRASLPDSHDTDCT